MRVTVLALDGVLDLGLSAVLEAFGTANELREMMGLRVVPIDVTVVGLRKSVKTAHGLRVPVSAPTRPAPDLVVVPAIAFKMPDALEVALRRRDVAEAALALQRWSRGGATIAAACVGTFVLAESGLLDGQRATTTWWLAPLFRRRYPDVLLEQSSMVVRSGRVVTAGAALGHMDLALALVRGVSPQLASLTARYLVVDARPSQSAYALADHLTHDDPLVRRFDSWAHDALPRAFSLDEAARAVGTSKRTLARRLHTVLGLSPLSYVQQLRVQQAVHLLRTTEASVDDIAARVGYADATTLRTLLRRQLARGVRDIRLSR